MFTDYMEALRDAQRKAKQYNREMGIEATKQFGRKGFLVHMLPIESKRQGFELRCEIVRPNDIPV